MLRQGDAERIVGLAVSTDDADGVTATCPGGDDLVLAVDGDAGTGAITAFELDAELSVARLRVAGTDYEFRETALAVDDASGTSGAFSSGTGDGGTLGGAFPRAWRAPIVRATCSRPRRPKRVSAARPGGPTRRCRSRRRA